MKKKLRIFLALALVISTLALSSCNLTGLSSVGGAVGEDYMTRSEVEELIAGLDRNVTVNGGDNHDITINSDSNGSLLAASKGLLSVVSVICNFQITKHYYGGGFMSGSTKTEQATSAGAGVIYQLDKESGDAYVITNFHVVYHKSANTEDKISDDIKLYLYGQEYERYAIKAEYIGGSSNYDIAVLKVEGSQVLTESIARAADFADSKQVAVLDTAIAIGNPEADGISATVGAVNVDSEELTMTNVQETGSVTLRVMRIDVAVNGGNSGGALFNDKGEVIGIVNAKMSDSSIDNIAYAIPSNVAKNVADNIIYYDSIDPDCDSVMRTIIGIEPGINKAYSIYDEQTGKVHKMEQVVVANVTSGSAAYGKLKSGDILKSVTIDGKTYDITRKFDVFDAMLKVKNSDDFTSVVSFVIIRDGREMTVTVDISGVTTQAW